VPAAQALQALLLLVQLSQGQLALGDLLVQFGQVLGALSQELGPFRLAGGGVDASQPLGIGVLVTAYVQHDRFATAGLDQLDSAGDAVGEGRGGRGQPGRLADRNCPRAAQLPPHRHPMA
jgi:hypothetical protein